ncbi:MAG: hypothetical protein HUU37_06000 [Bdellovibrionales bacterium]|nr:hypothetical protein [Bdellovibrionales bacterium]
MRNRSLALMGISIVAFCLGFHALGAAKGRKKARPPVAQCYLHGIVRAKDESKKPELSDMIRMRFDADSRDKCKRMLDAYCRYNIRDRGYLAGTLEAYWRPDVNDDSDSDKVTFTFTDKCMVSASDENG